MVFDMILGWFLGGGEGWLGAAPVVSGHHLGMIWICFTNDFLQKSKVLHTAASRHGDSISYHNTYIWRPWHPTSEA